MPDNKAPTQHTINLAAAIYDELVAEKFNYDELVCFGKALHSGMDRAEALKKGHLPFSVFRRLINVAEKLEARFGKPEEKKPEAPAAEPVNATPSKTEAPEAEPVIAAPANGQSDRAEAVS